MGIFARIDFVKNHDFFKCRFKILFFSQQASAENRALSAMQVHGNHFFTSRFVWETGVVPSNLAVCSAKF